MGDCARVTVQITMNFDFCPLCCEIKICQKFCKSSPVTVLYMCKSDNETSTSMLDSRLEGQFSLSSFLLVIFSKDIYSTCDFIYAQCLDAVPSNKVQIYIIEKSKLCTTVCNICKEILNRAFADYLVSFISASYLRSRALCNATSISYSRFLGVGIVPHPC